MIVTVNLSKGALAMSKKKVIVKRLNSIQNFGAIDILCTDKTGTLTQDRVILEKAVDVTNRDSEDVLRYAYMNSYYQTGLRNLLDRSVLSHSEFDVERGCRKVDEIPFDFQRKRMSVVVDYEGDHVLICKGAVEDIYKVCAPLPGGRRGPHDDRPHQERPAGGIRGTKPRRLPRPRHRLPRISADQDNLFRGRRERPDPARLHRLPRSAQGFRGQGHRLAQAVRRGHQNSHRRQCARDAQDLQGCRPRRAGSHHRRPACRA